MDDQRRDDPQLSVRSKPRRAFRAAPTAAAQLRASRSSANRAVVDACAPRSGQEAQALAVRKEQLARSSSTSPGSSARLRITPRRTSLIRPSAEQLPLGRKHAPIAHAPVP